MLRSVTKNLLFRQSSPKTTLITYYEYIKLTTSYFLTFNKPLNAGEKIFSEGDFSFPFYIIVASDETAETAGVEVLKDAGGSERLMTRLHRGLTFFFLMHSIQNVSSLSNRIKCVEIVS
jgi:hypothetical protein